MCYIEFVESGADSKAIRPGPQEEKQMRTVVAIIVMTMVIAVGIFADDNLLNRPDAPVNIELSSEAGFVKVLTHTITIGDPTANDAFDYVRQGGQEILAPFYRFTAEIGIGAQDTVTLLYQPLSLATQSRFDADVTLDGITFEAGQVVDITYDFPFYRVSYLHDFVRRADVELAAGMSLQLRNASVRFDSINQIANGSNDRELVISQNLGPVPIIKVRAGYHMPEGLIPGAFVELEADGFYASSRFFNGASYPFEGSIFDASLRAGFMPRPGLEVFGNVRLLGGGANGTRGDAREYWTESVGGYTDNFLTTLSFTVGARLR